jgi:YD repeat-containing protein
MVVTNALSQATTIVSDMTIGRPTSVTDPLGRTIAYQYDSDRRPIRVTAPEGNYVQYSYDSRGNVTERRAVAKSGTGLPDIVTSATFDTTCADPETCNRMNSSTDARGNVTNYTYDAAHGGVLTVTGPAPGGSGDRPQTRYAYTLTNGEYRLTGVSVCAAGTAPSCVGTASETRATIAYDANGNVTSRTVADGAGTLSAAQAMTYDALGNLLTVDGPVSGTADTRCATATIRRGRWSARSGRTPMAPARASTGRSVSPIRTACRRGPRSARSTVSRMATGRPSPRSSAWSRITTPTPGRSFSG